MNNLNLNSRILQMQGQCNTLTNVSLTCPGNITQGTSVPFTITWSGGQGPFTVGIYEQGGSYPFIFWQLIVNGGTVTDTINLSAGSHDIYAVVADFCNTEVAQSYSSSPICTLDVSIPCIQNYQCRTPLDGYESDLNNCPGSVDRLNSLCNPVAIQQPCTQGDINIFGTCIKQNYLIAGVSVTAIAALLLFGK